MMLFDIIVNGINALQLNVEILPKDAEKENHAFSSHQLLF